jgi:hypothetical protein
MSYTGHDFTAAQDAIIRSKMAPDAIIAAELGLTTMSVQKRRQRLRGRSVEQAAAVAHPKPTKPELIAVAREEIEALEWRITDTRRILSELGRMLEAAEMRLARLL